MNFTLIYIIHIRNIFRMISLICFSHKTMDKRSETEDEKHKTKGVRLLHPIKPGFAMMDGNRTALK